MQQKNNLVGTMLVGHNAINLSVNPHEGRRSDIGLTLRNARDVLLHRMLDMQLTLLSRYGRLKMLQK